MDQVQSAANKIKGTNRREEAAVIAWLLVYALALAVQHLVVDGFYGIMTHLFNGGVLLVALLDLTKRAAGATLLVVFVAVALALDWYFKFAIAGAELQPAFFMSLTLAIQALLGVQLLKRADLATRLPDSQRHVLSFAWRGMLLPVLFSSFLMASVASAYALESDLERFGEELLWWFVSRFTSVVLIAPVLLLGLRQYFSPGQLDCPAFDKEFWWLAVTAVLWAYTLFTVANPPGRALATYGYLLIPLMLVVAFRQPVFQAQLITLLVSLVCFWADAETSIASDQARRSLMALSVFLVINAGIVWLVGVLIQERSRSFSKEKKQRALYEMQSRVNQTIVKYELDQEALFGQVCQIILEECQFKQVCVVPNLESSRPLPGSVVCLNVSGKSVMSASEINSGCELISTVLQENRATWFSSCQLCPKFADCKFKPVSKGGTAAFPIRTSSGVAATLAIFTGRPMEFDEDLLRLFQEVANDLGYALAMYDQRQYLDQIAEVFHYSRESIIIADTKGAILNVNPSFTRITGYSREEALGNNPRILKSGRQDQSFYENLFQQLATHGYWSGQFWNKRKNGDYYLQRGTISAVRDKHGAPAHYIAVMEDVSSQVEADEKIQTLANFDQLTGLPNRILLADRFNQTASHFRREGVERAIMFIDLDDFKHINDALGHHIGDELLKEISQNLRKHVRETDTLCRFGGDEFVVLVEGGASEAAELAERLISVVSQVYELHGTSLQVGASVGIAILFQDGDTLDQLIQAADTAMNQAKSEARGSFSFFAKAMQSKVHSRLLLKQALKKAIAENELCLFYQPKVASGPGGGYVSVGYEALVRWNHPERGMVPPGEFIPAAEENGQIAEIDRWVLRQGISQLTDWLRQYPGDVLPVAINVSASLFSKPGFVDDLKVLLEASCMPPELLELEITEHVATIDMSRTLRTLIALKHLGVRLAIDDFGTGYSSLSYLQQFPVDHLKIDLSFVRDIHIDAKKQGLVRAIITMAHSLDMKTIAEGVEVREELEFLQDNGCDAYQGYYFGKPVSAAECQRVAMPALTRL